MNHFMAYRIFSIFGILVNINCMVFTQNKGRFLRNESDIKIIHEVSNHSTQSVFTYSKPLVLEHSGEYLIVFGIKSPSYDSGFGSSSDRNPSNSLLEIPTYAYDNYFTKVEIDSKYIKVCKLKTNSCRFLENGGEFVKAVYLSNHQLKTKYENDNPEKVNFSLIQIESSKDKKFENRDDLFLTDLNKKYIRLIPLDSSFTSFEYSLESNTLFITVLYDSNKDGQFSEALDREAVLRVDIRRPSIGVEIIDKKEIEQLFLLDKKNTN
ncbi:hypothetical protein V6Z05_14850 [Leptospira venezuelensis]|uniref:hypothetical protein n=1 Tax=Leptospira venezuelensis TaxID=1958811 RepID=UPI000A39557C|nr:hypothetical protein [Leptospira venezuelensis]